MLINWVDNSLEAGSPGVIDTQVARKRRLSPLASGSGVTATLALSVSRHGRAGRRLASPARFYVRELPLTGVVPARVDGIGHLQLVGAAGIDGNLRPGLGAFFRCA